MIIKGLLNLAGLSIVYALAILKSFKRMKKRLLVVFFLLNAILSFSQDFRGQWKGEFIDKSTSFESFGGEKCDYVLELETKGNIVSGFSYTYFTDDDKRFYTICKVTGFINKKNKYIEVKETERTKTNVPIHIRNCFQTHKLTYFKQGSNEVLEGKWIPAPNQDGDCGYGLTNLTRRVLISYKPSVSVKPGTVTVKKANPRIPDLSDKNKTPTLVKKALPKNNVGSTPKILPTEPPKKNDVAVVPIPQQTDPEQVRKVSPAPEYRRRNTNILKTLEVTSETIRVDLYDNGEIDGDSVSLFYNGKLFASKKRLSEKALSFTLPVDKELEENVLMMYAENLGSIPPNTAVMIVTDGTRRFEVRITSDLQKSGVIHFVHADRNKEVEK